MLTKEPIFQPLSREVTTSGFTYASMGLAIPREPSLDLYLLSYCLGLVPLFISPMKSFLTNFYFYVTLMLLEHSRARSLYFMFLFFIRGFEVIYLQTTTQI